MLKGLSAILVAAVLAAAPAHAQQFGRQQQQQQQPLSPIDPYSFHSLEGAMTPAEAAAQVDLMSKAMSSLPPQRPGVVDTYVLVAAFWDDPVFESEARETAAVLGRRYDAGERTIVLTAGQGGARAFPDSSPMNVQAALGKISTVIDAKEDLVVVFLTSHGAQDGTVAIQEKLRVQGGLRPINLRNSLQQAGIQNKLIIVSACFSGHFVTPFFPDPNAAVFTAAATDKTSFGCEPSRDWTYFGDAFMNHALRGGAPLEEAFTDALGLIGKWEGDLHDKWAALPASRRDPAAEPQPSNPQSNIGAAIAPVIDKAEAYGRAVNCAGNLAFALDRAKTGRPLKGLADWDKIQAARDKQEAIAAREGAPRKRSAQDTARAIGTVAAAALKVATPQAADLAVRVQRCMATAAD